MTAKKKNFMTGALVLMVGGIIVKLIGALYKVPLANLVSGEAMAYYSNAYDIYTFMYIIATAALPVVISRMVSEDVALGKYKQAKKTVRVAFLMFALLGFAGMAFMLVFAKGLAGAMSSPESYCAILAIAPAIFFEALMSLYRGYFQGHQDMVPTAISQIIVAIIKAVFGYSLALWLTNKGYSMAIVAAGAIFGVTLGTVVGAVFLAIRRMFFKPEYNTAIEDNTCRGSASLAKKILWIMIPITISSSVLSVTNLLDAAVVQNRLDTIASTLSHSVDMIYGSYSGYARVLFSLPTALIIPMGTGIIPSISAAFASKKIDETKNMISSTFRISVFLALPCGIGLSVMANPILSLLYPSKPVEVSIAAPLLRLLGPAVVFVCLVSITNVMLQAIGKEWMPVFTMFVGGGIKLAMNYIMVGTPSININGAPISTNVCYAVITILNLIVISKVLGKGLGILSAVVKPVIAAALCGVGAYFTYGPVASRMGNAIGLGASICVAALIYFVSLGIMKWYRGEDVRLLPMGEKIEKILAKIGWIV